MIIINIKGIWQKMNTIGRSEQEDKAQLGTELRGVAMHILYVYQVVIGQQREGLVVRLLPNGKMLLCIFCVYQVATELKDTAMYNVYGY